MGDRDYFRDSEPPRRRLGLAIWIIIVCVGIHAFQLLWQYVIFRSSPHAHDLDRYFALHPLDVVHRFRIWQVLTCVFLSHDTLQLLFDMLPIFFFGRMIEETFGKRQLATVCVAGSVLSSLAFVVIAWISGFPGTAWAGATGAVMAILVVSALQWPNTSVIFFFIPMPLKYLCLLLVAVYAAHGVRTLGVGAAAPLAGAAFGLAYWKLKDRVSATLVRWDEQHARRERRKDEEKRINQEGRIDGILEKIAREGIQSLTAEERRLLDEASRRKRSP
ncbi:MAG: rhomboid family intramembrane serine protease [Candidatus Brocadiae bacterium]|nr:rhomboid family intramembrane serine protease [Candidatus Brocadiia bacterium]